MKQNKIIDYLKIGILFFSISLFFLYSCEQEILETTKELNNEQNTDLDFKLENLTFNQADSQPAFSKLKTKFNIEELINNSKEEKYFSKVESTYSNSTSSNDFSDLDPSVDVSVVRKITTENYVSYTMRLVEPQDTSNSFSNVVVQESNGVQEIFTVRYTPTQTQAEQTPSTNSFEGTYTMSNGLILYDGWDDVDDGTGGGTDGFVEICNDVIVIIAVECQCSHNPGEYCDGCSGSGTYHYTIETQQVCYWDYQGGNGNTGGNPGGTNPGNGGTGTPTNPDGTVVTSPLIDVENCNGGKIPNAVTGICECPEGKVENDDGICEDDCNTSKKDLKLVFPNTSDSVLEEIANFINIHGKDFGINTKEKLQHFLSQAGHESTNYAGIEFGVFTENLNYRVNQLGTADYWEKYFNPITNPTADPNKANPNDYIGNTNSSGVVYVNHESFANYVYNDEYRDAGYKLGNTNTGDGYKYIGRGIIQLTGRNNYTNFNTFYQSNYDNTINLVDNPSLVASNKEIAVISALWFFKNNVIDNLANGIDENTGVLEVTEKVNGGDNGLNHRKELHTSATEHIDCL